MIYFYELNICPKTKMTYISSCGDLCDDEDIYPCVLEYLIQNCPHYAEYREIDYDDFQLMPMDEVAMYWESVMRV